VTEVVDAAGGVVVVVSRLVTGVALVAEPNRVGGRAGIRFRLPKGLIEPSETPDVAARREVLEEAGISADVVCDLGVASWPYQYAGRELVKRVVFFLMIAREGPALPRVDDVVRGLAVVSHDIVVDALHFDSERRVAEEALNTEAFRSILGSLGEEV
jgi:8-oxo-dGTP pyrophosphatase MutT (NUDIX family)